VRIGHLRLLWITTISDNTDTATIAPRESART